MVTLSFLVTIQGSGAFRQQGDDCLTTTVTADRGGEIGERIQLLDLAGPRDREQPRHRELAVGAARAETDFSPLNRRPESPLGRGMPRAGLCRVGVNRTPWFAVDHAFAFAGVSA